MYYNNTIIDDRHFESYISFDGVVDYDDLFYEPRVENNYLFYSLGLTCQEIAHLNKNKLYSTNLRIFDEEKVKEFNSILKECKFKSVSKRKAVLLAPFASIYTNVAYTSAASFYFDPETLWFQQRVLNDVNEKGMGVCKAVINRIFGKTYLFARFYTKNMSVSVDGVEYSVPYGTNNSIGVFELVRNDAEKKLISNRKSYNYNGKNAVNGFSPINYNFTLPAVGCTLATTLLYFLILLNGKRKHKKKRRKGNFRRFVDMYR